MEKIDSYRELCNDAKSHKRFYYYTDLNTLKLILSNKSLQLSRLDTVNDQYENKCVSEIWKKKIFVACFSHKENESFFFWNTYAARSGKENGVSIVFSNSILKDKEIYSNSDCLGAKFCSVDCSDVKYKSFVEPYQWAIYDISKCDISYCHNNLDIVAENDYNALTKSIEWKDEEETRIRVAFRPKGLEINLNREKNKFEIIFPNFEKVFLKLEQKDLLEANIIVNPWVSDSFKSEVLSTMLKNGINEAQLKASSMTGKVLLDKNI